MTKSLIMFIRKSYMGAGRLHRAGTFYSPLDLMATVALHSSRSQVPRICLEYQRDSGLR